MKIYTPFEIVFYALDHPLITLPCVFIFGIVMMLAHKSKSELWSRLFGYLTGLAGLIFALALIETLLFSK
jgi:hypothetical protein